jgi:protein-S-isoprenylcysteine O-methyltransferase Ste14
MILPLLAGAASFPVLLLSDYADLHSLRSLKIASMLAAAGLLGYGLVASMLDPWKAHLPVAVRSISIVLAVAFLLLLVTSLFLEIPGQKGDGGKGLVTTGTYALVRHPGVIWLFFFLLCLSVVSDSLVLLAATPLWTAIDLLYVVVQDRLIFPRLFGDSYRDYRRVTPFIIPTARSIRLCLETWHALFRRTARNGGHYGNGE